MKRLLTLLLSALMTVPLAGCGEEEASDNPDSGTTRETGMRIEEMPDDLRIEKKKPKFTLMSDQEAESRLRRIPSTFGVELSKSNQIQETGNSDSIGMGGAEEKSFQIMSESEADNRATSTVPLKLSPEETYRRDIQNYVLELRTEYELLQKEINQAGRSDLKIDLAFIEQRLGGLELAVFDSGFGAMTTVGYADLQKYVESLIGIIVPGMDYLRQKL